MSKLNSSYSKINRIGGSILVTVTSFALIIYILLHFLFQAFLFLYYSGKSLVSKQGLVMFIILSLCFIVDVLNLIICWYARSRGIVHKFLRCNRKRIEGTGRILLALKTTGVVLYMKFVLFKVGVQWIDKIHSVVTEPTSFIILDSIVAPIFLVWGALNFRGKLLLTSKNR